VLLDILPVRSEDAPSIILRTVPAGRLLPGAKILKKEGEIWVKMGTIKVPKPEG